MRDSTEKSNGGVYLRRLSLTRSLLRSRLRSLRLSLSPRLSLSLLRSRSLSLSDRRLPSLSLSRLSLSRESRRLLPLLLLLLRSRSSVSPSSFSFSLPSLPSPAPAPTAAASPLVSAFFSPPAAAPSAPRAPAPEAPASLSAFSFASLASFASLSALSLSSRLRLRVSIIFRSSSLSFSLCACLSLARSGVARKRLISSATSDCLSAVTVCCQNERGRCEQVRDPTQKSTNKQPQLTDLAQAACLKSASSSLTGVIFTTNTKTIR